MTMVQAHRGASGYAPENTLAAFQMAVDMNADGIECDIHLSKDGVFVVCHDETIDRTSDGSGKINEMTYAEISKHNFGCKFHPHYFSAENFLTAPTLEQMLDVVKDMRVINIEVKEFAGDEAKALNDFYAILEKYGIIDRVIVSSFNVGLLKRLKALHPDLFTGYLYHPGVKSDTYECFPWEVAVQTALDHNCNAIHPEIKSLTKEVVYDAHAHGLKVNCWTANNREMVEKAIEIGCDGLISNYPDWGLKAVGR